MVVLSNQFWFSLKNLAPVETVTVVWGHKNLSLINAYYSHSYAASPLFSRAELINSVDELIQQQWKKFGFNKLENSKNLDRCAPKAHQESLRRRNKLVELSITSSY